MAVPVPASPSKGKAPVSDSNASTANTEHRRKKRQAKHATGTEMAATNSSAVAHTIAPPPLKAKQVQWDTLVEGSMTKLPVVFTRDADYFFLVAKTAIKIYSRQTGQVVSTLSTAKSAHTAAITAMFINPDNPLQLLTSSLDGHIKVWDFLDGRLLKDLNVGLPITNMAAHASFPNMVFVTVKKLRQSHTDQSAQPSSSSKSKRSDAAAHDYDQLDADRNQFNSILYTVSLSSPLRQTVKGTYKPELVRIGKTRDATALGISPNGKWLVVIGNRKVQVANTSNLRSGFTKFSTTAQGDAGDRMTCLAFHPTEEARIVTGDDKGRIRVWYCLDEKLIAQAAGNNASSASLEAYAPSTVLHWHAHAVSSLAFTPNGAHLLSGGEEGVLVVWQLHSSGGAGTSKEFVPRLGAPVTSIAVANGLNGREQEYALGLADGTVTFVGAMQLKPTRSFSRIKIDTSRHAAASSSVADPVADGTPTVPLAIHPATGNLVLASGHPSSIQFYDAERNVNAMELEIAPSNRISRADEEPIEPTRVEKVVFSPSPSEHTGERGEWMVTFDSRNLDDEDEDDEPVVPGAQVLSESSLKFWRWDRSARRYMLNTRIDAPHAGKRVTSLAFSPAGAGDLLITTGRDGRTRSWTVMSRTLKSGRTESYWVCRSVFHYRSSIPVCSAFSPDGSLLAVGQGSFVTLWAPDATVLQTTLSCPEMRAQISHVSFAGRSGRYLLLASAHTIVAWDLVLARVAWRRETRGRVLALEASAKGEETLLVCTERGLTSLEHIAAHDGSTTARDEMRALRLRAALPAARVGLTVDYDVVRIGSLPPASKAASLRGIEPVRRTLFDDLFGPSLIYSSSTTVPAPVDTAPQQATGTSALFNAPPHLLPPLTALLDDFIKRSLPPRAQDTPTVPETAADAAPVQEDPSSTSEKPTSTSQSYLSHTDETNHVLDTDVAFLGDLFRSMLGPKSKSTTKNPSPRKTAKA